MTVRVSAGVAVLRDKSVLLIRRALEPCTGIWSLPIGGVNQDETVEECAVRETREEVGYNVTLDKLIAIHWSMRLEIVLLVYTGHIIDGKLALSDEVTEASFFPLMNLPPSQPTYRRTPYNIWASRTNRSVLLRLRRFQLGGTPNLNKPEPKYFLSVLNKTSDLKG